MVGIQWILGAVLVASAGAEPTEFPCAKLGDDILEVHDGFAAAAAPSPVAVAVKKKAVLFDFEVELVRETLTLADPALADGKTMVFRRYRSGEEAIVCTRMRSDRLFGAGDQARQYALRCLADRDRDGAYEGFTRRLELVAVKPGEAPPIASAPETSELLPLAGPVTLVSRAGLSDQGLVMTPKARMRIWVSRVDGNQVELSFSGQVSSLPNSVAGRFFARGGTAVVSMPMTDGGEIPLAGTRIRFARQGGKWTAAVLDGFGNVPQLHCAGTVAEIGDSFTVLGTGGQSIIARANLERIAVR